MLPRPPACCRAVKRQLLQPSDSVWVSDEVLLRAFKRFVTASRTAKRYGSFVPGPLESRRRLGKRRMAHLSESIPTSTHNWGPLWDLFGQGDRTQWQWEAPTTRKSGESSAPALPAWLVDWETSPQVVLESVPAINATNKATEGALSPERDIINFQARLQAARPDEMLEICDEFNQRFKQSLTLGLISEATIYDALKTVSREIRLTSSNLDLIDNQCLLSFYQSFWDGVMSCKVLQPVDLDTKILDRFLFCLGKLSICPEVQALFHGVMHAASVTQLGKMRNGVSHLVKAWAQSWLHERPVAHLGLSFSEAERTLLESATKLDHLHNLTNASQINLDNRLDLSMIRDALQEARISFDYALESTLEAEKLTTPVIASIDNLSYVLGYLPRRLLDPLLRSCTRFVIDMHNSMETPRADLHYAWLSLVAKLPEVDDRFFVNVVKKMEECKAVPKHSIPGGVVLSRWISQGHFAHGDLVRNAFEISAYNSGSLDLGLVLLAIDKHREKMFSRAMALFKLLEDLGRYKEVYQILARIEALGMKLPVWIISPAIETMSKYDLELAHSIYQLYFRLRVDRTPFPSYLTPNFIVSMIHHREFHPKKIWKIMRIPIYECMNPSARAAFSEKRLSPAVIRLVTKMAVAFAHSEAWPQRVAFRNVLQCLHHLRRHGAPITSELTRAVSYVGFTRKILAGQWISRELLSWALGLIEWVEGTEVATITEKGVKYWNEQLEAKQQKEARESNVLRVGPIS